MQSHYHSLLVWSCFLKQTHRDKHEAGSSVKLTSLSLFLVVSYHFHFCHLCWHGSLLLCNLQCHFLNDAHNSYCFLQYTCSLSICAFWGQQKESHTDHPCHVSVVAIANSMIFDIFLFCLFFPWSFLLAHSLYVEHLIFSNSFLISWDNHSYWGVYVHYQLWTWLKTVSASGLKGICWSGTVQKIWLLMVRNTWCTHWFLWHVWHSQLHSCHLAAPCLWDIVFVHLLHFHQVIL